LGKKEYVGSPDGTTIIKVKKKKHGISAKISGKPYELLQIAALLVETVQTNTGASKQDAVGALLEIIYQEDFDANEEVQS